MFLRVITATLLLCGVAMAAGSRPVCPDLLLLAPPAAIPMWPLTKTGILRRGYANRLWPGAVPDRIQPNCDRKFDHDHRHRGRLR